MRVSGRKTRPYENETAGRAYGIRKNAAGENTKEADKVKELPKELIAKLNEAQSAEEAAGLLKAEGLDRPVAEKLFRELRAAREREGRELSIDELDAVAGGADRDWLTDGCAATVEPDSWCGSDDACLIDDVTYDHEPVAVCEKCGGYMYETYSWELVYWKCKTCGFSKQRPY